MCQEQRLLMATRYDEHHRTLYNRHNNNSNYYNPSQNRKEHPSSSHHNNLIPSTSSAPNKARYRTHNESEGGGKRSGGKEKSRLVSFGDWSEYKSSSGKIYYYNQVTEVSQWEKPPGWAEEEKRRQRNGIDGKGRNKDRNHYPSSFDSGSNHSNVGSGGRPSSSGFQQMEEEERSSSRSRDSHSRSPSLSSYNKEKERRKRERESPGRGPPRKKPSTSKFPYNLDDASEGHLSSILSTKEKPSSQVDLSKLPQLLLRLADQYKIDLHEERAVDKLKLFLKQRVKPEGESSSPCLLDGEGESESVLLERLKQFESTSSTTSSTDPQHFPPTSSSNSGSLDRREDGSDGKMDVGGSGGGGGEDECGVNPLPPFSSHKHSPFCREDLARHTRGWSAEYFENQAWVWAGSLLNGSVQLGQIMADLKCARSLVRTAEIRSTLIDHRLRVVRQQIKQFDPQQKSSAVGLGGGVGGGGSGSSTSGSVVSVSTAASATFSTQHCINDNRKRK